MCLSARPHCAPVLLSASSCSPCPTLPQATCTPLSSPDALDQPVAPTPPLLPGAAATAGLHSQLVFSSKVAPQPAVWARCVLPPCLRSLLAAGSLPAFLP